MYVFSNGIKISEGSEHTDLFKKRSIVVKISTMFIATCLVKKSFYFMRRL